MAPCLLWAWVVGMGETVEMDERGRITLPAKTRETLGAKKFRITQVDRGTITLAAIRDLDRVEAIRKIRLKGDKARSHLDAASVKDQFGGVKD